MLTVNEVTDTHTIWHAWGTVGRNHGGDKRVVVDLNADSIRVRVPGTHDLVPRVLRYRASRGCDIRR